MSVKSVRLLCGRILRTVTSAVILSLLLFDWAICGEAALEERLVPKLELDFFKQVLEPVLRPAENSEQQYDALGGWFVGEVHEGGIHRKFEILSSTYVFFGTLEKGSEDELSNTHIESLQNGTYKVCQNLVRLPAKERNPKLVIVAVTKVLNEQLSSDVRLYLTEKKFHFKAGLWKLGSSTIRLIE